MRNISHILFIFLSLILISCSSSNDDSSPQLNDDVDVVNSLELYISADEVTTGSTVLFTAFDNNGKNRTAEVKFYINDSEIPGSSHTFNDTGEFDIYAKYQNIKSQTLQLIVNLPPIEYKKYVLVEDYTGTWCGYCTRVSFAIEEVKKQTDDAVIIAIHSGDEMQFSQVGTLINAFQYLQPGDGFGLPTAFIDRQVKWSYPEPSYITQVTSKLSRKSYAALAMESSIDGQDLSVKVKLKIGYNYKSLKLGLYLLEDKLIYNQRNWTTYYQGDPIVNYEHNDVLRASISGLLGDQIPPENLGHDKEFEKKFTFTIPNQYNKDNLKMIAFVTEGDKKEAINVRLSNIGEAQSFEK